MTVRARVTAISVAVLSLSLAASVLVLRGIDRVRSDATLEETLYIPSPKVVKKLSFGYDGLMADIYWTRVVQYFGALHHERSKRYTLLYPLLDISTTLDPHLLPAYQFGAIFLSQQPPEGAGQPERAIEVVNRGIDANPKEWRLYYNLGFIYYDQKDYANAARAFERGSNVPGANRYLKILQAAMTDKAGSSDTARLLWRQIYETSDDLAIRSGALAHLIALQIDEDIVVASKLVADYQNRTGHLPANFQEMVAAGWLRQVPSDPTGDPYRLLPNGRVEVHSPKPFVHYGLPAAPQGPPESASAPTKE